MPEENKDEPQENKPIVQRDERGRLLPGSNLVAATGAKPSGFHIGNRVQQMKHAMLNVATPEVMAELTGKLIALCKSEDDKVALSAIELFFNRILGKAKEHVEIDVNTQPAPLVLSPDDLDAMEAAIRRERRKLNEPEVIVRPE